MIITILTKIDVGEFPGDVSVSFEPVDIKTTKESQYKNEIIANVFSASYVKLVKQNVVPLLDQNHDHDCTLCNMIGCPAHGYDVSDEPDSFASDWPFPSQ